MIHKWIEDGVIYLFLIMAIFLYKMTISHLCQNKTPTQQKYIMKLQSRFLYLAVSLLTLIFTVGILYQIGLLPRILAWILMGFVLLFSFVLILYIRYIISKLAAEEKKNEPFK